jgi:transcriptional regulator with XRE-family HTH domain
MKDKVISNIKTIRESKNFTAEYLATQLGISQSTYSRKENGEADFTLPELVKVSEALEVPLVKIIDLDLARVLHQNNYDTATGNQNIIEHQTISAEGYIVAIDTLKEEIAYLRAQVDKLMDKLGG